VSTKDAYDFLLAAEYIFPQNISGTACSPRVLTKIVIIAPISFVMYSQPLATQSNQVLQSRNLAVSLSTSRALVP
jgi:hypothetical protein